MQHLKIKHQTIYKYPAEVTLLPHKLLLRPREGHYVRIKKSQLNITPNHQLRWHRDAHDNSVGVVNFLEPGDELVIASEVIIEARDDAPLDFLIEDYAVNFPFVYQVEEANDLLPYQQQAYLSDNEMLKGWVKQFWREGEVIETYVLLENINKAITEQITYKVREEPGVQSPATTLSDKTGSCRDMATLFIEACRLLGLAARFISGYQYIEGLATDAGATHAWSEIYLPGAGWKGFDSTTGKLVDNHYIPIAVATHPEVVPPISGAFAGAIESQPVMTVTVDITAVSG